MNLQIPQAMTENSSKIAIGTGTSGPVAGKIGEHYDSGQLQP
jgi:hypothetical protein